MIELGDRVAPPVHGWGRDWLFAIAVSGALGGILTSALVGRKLVGLEVANQKIEARLRTKLVLLAERPDEAPPPPVSNSFQMVLKDMWQNYHRLFTEFVWMNTWLSTFDQAWVIIPYVLCAPLLFADDPSRRISLGTLVATSNAFGKVFDSLAVLSDAWPAVNAFRSVVRRLREFEAKVYENKSAARLARVAATVSSGTCSATRHMELAEVDADLVDPATTPTTALARFPRTRRGVCERDRSLVFSFTPHRDTPTHRTVILGGVTLVASYCASTCN